MVDLAKADVDSIPNFPNIPALESEAGETVRWIRQGNWRLHEAIYLYCGLSPLPGQPYKTSMRSLALPTRLGVTLTAALQLPELISRSVAAKSLNILGVSEPIGSSPVANEAEADGPTLRGAPTVPVGWLLFDPKVIITWLRTLLEPEGLNLHPTLATALDQPARSHAELISEIASLRAALDDSALSALTPTQRRKLTDSRIIKRVFKLLYLSAQYKAGPADVITVEQLAEALEEMTYVPKSKPVAEYTTLVRYMRFARVVYDSDEIDTSLLGAPS